MTPARWLPGILLAALLCAGLPRIVRSQSDTLPAEVAALFDDINDIDKLRVLNPLKLTPDQIDQLITTIRQARTDYNKRLTDAAVPPIRQIAQDIKETRRKMLTGAPVPKNFDEQVKKMQDDFLSRRDKADLDTLKSLSDSTRKILTAEQFKQAVTLARTLTAKDGKPTLKGEDEKFYNFYVLQTFIVYPRIVPLLEDMKKAAGGESARVPAARRHASR